ncbi:Transcription Elongation Factor A Protein 1 [Manis pentadactyla]|nr:Transcription Elongation Factor A Protein 1 [Manis pentadactyla]
MRIPSEGAGNTLEEAFSVFCVEVVHIRKFNMNFILKAGALDLLKELKNVPMTLELLQSIRIGMLVNAIHKQSTDEEVTSLAKSLIKSWKKLLDDYIAIGADEEELGCQIEEDVLCVYTHSVLSNPLDPL